MFTKLYRIHTEWRPEYERNIREIVGIAFDAYTITHADGVWNGEKEHAVIIEIYANDGLSTFELIQAIAKEIKEKNNQEAVLIASFDVYTDLI